jgi:hypothetical protein
MANQTKNNQKIQMNVTPTLIVMEGSTAGKIGYRVKQLIQRHYDDIPVVRFLWIDTDSTVPEGAKNWFSREERAELVGFDANEVLQNLAKFPTLSNWWPKNTNIHAGMISKGAPQQMRLIGRLSLFRKFNEAINGSSFLSKLQHAVESIHQIENINATREKSNEEIKFDVTDNTRVVFIFSTCGGTGSSISFDTAYLCRRFLRGHHPEMMAVSILPPVIDHEIKDGSSLQRRKIRANTYAWFKENQYLMDHPNWYVEYPGIAPVDVAHMPFDVHFVIDMVNEANNRLNSADDIYNMISQAIFLDTGTAIAGENSSSLTNVIVLDSYAPGRKQAYSSLASASIIYPAERLQNYCGHRFAYEVIDKALFREPNVEMVKNTLSNNLSELGLYDDVLVRTLREDRWVDLLKKPVIMKSDSVKSAKTLLEVQMKGADQRLNEESKLLEKKEEELFNRIKTILETQITAMVTKNGITNAFEMIEQLCSINTIQENMPPTSLHVMRTRISKFGTSEKEISEKRAAFDKALIQLSDLDGNLLRSVQNVLLRKQWENTFTDKKKVCLTTMELYIEAKLSYEAQKVAKDLYSKLLAFLQIKFEELEAIHQTLQKTREELEKMAKISLEPRITAEGIFELKREVLGEKKNFLDFYSDKSKILNHKTIYQNYAESLKYDDLSALQTWAKVALKDELVKYCKNEFSKSIESTSLLDAVNQYYGEKAPQKIGAMLDDLLAYCNPFWQFERDKGRFDQEGKSIIGVQNKNSKLIPERFRQDKNFNMVSTGFKHSIDVVRVKHGVPAFLIKDMDEYKFMYDLVRSQTRDPLHILPNADEFEDLFPDEHKESRQLFSLGLVFGFIVQIGTFYYVDLSREYSGPHKIKPTPEFLLDQGRSKAEEALIHKPNFRKQLDRKIEELVQNMGNKAAITEIENAITDLKKHISGLSARNEHMRPQLRREIAYLRDYQRMLGAIVKEF